MKKKLLIIILLLSILMINTIEVHADNNSIFDGSYGDDDQPQNPTDQSNTDNDKKCENSKTAGRFESCNIRTTNHYASSVNIDIYDTKGKYIGNALEISNIEFEAGRFVGIDAYEIYTNKTTKSYSPSCYDVEVTCNRIIEGTPYKCCSNGKIANNPSRVRINGKMVDVLLCDDGTYPQNTCYTSSSTETYTRTQGSCDAGDEWVNAKCTPCTPSIDCEGQARRELENMSIDDKQSSYTAKRRDSNDIAKETTYPVESYKEVTLHPIIVEGYRTLSRTIDLRIKYNTQKTCLNVKSSQVRYISFEENCDSTKEITVKNYQNSDNQPIGMYFIPLNTKSNTFFNYFLESGQKQEQKLCETLITKYKSDGRWKIILLDESKNPFDINTSYDEGIDRVKSGCYYAFTLNFNIKQKFYNEKDYKIRGYGSFYRPIDINNPFPNGLSATSIWSGLIDTTNNVIKITNNKNEIIKKYNLNDSFKEKSYSIEHINANAIRDYNHQERNFYTSWEDMDVDGTSTFVNDYLTRYNSRDYYKLGCGPANSDWEECNQ